MTVSHRSYPIFHYTEVDFHFTVKTKIDEKSKFDTAIIDKWNVAEENNVLRYKLNLNNWKRLEGNNKFLAQLNLDRSQKRRRPEDIQSMTMPFDRNLFNFTKIHDKEIYFDIFTGDGDNIIVVNVSPLEFGHCLFLSHRLKLLPQIATEFSLLKTVELLLLSKSPYLRAVFNSLCAHASVNHLHWHLYYLKHNMLLENIDLHQLSDILYMLNDYPAKGFCIKFSAFNNDWQLFASTGYKILNFLQNQKIPHNVYLTRAKLSSKSEDLHEDLRMYIWPRKASTGIKDTSEFIPASCELFGHLVIRDEGIYNNLTESQVNAILEDITSDIVKEVKNDIIELMQS